MKKWLKILWWVLVVIFGVFMLVFTVAGSIPAWWTPVSVTVVGMVGILFKKPWKPPEGP